VVEQERGIFVLKRLRAHAPLLAVLVVALAYRLYLWKRSGVALYGDMLRYDTMAEHLVHLGYLGYGAGPDAFVTPLYPLFVALFYALLGAVHAHGLSHTRLVHEVYLVQQVLSLSSLVLAYIIGCQLQNRMVGLASAILSLVYLQNDFIGLMLLTEALFMPLLFLTLSLYIQAQKTGGRWWHAAAGIALGLTTLVRPTVLPLAVVFLLLDLWLRFGRSGRAVGTWERLSARRDYMRTSLFFVGAVILTLVPWWIRNEIDLHHFVLLSTEAGNPLLAGADPYFRVPVDALIQSSRVLHETQQTFAIHYALTGLRTHFFLFAGWYLFGKLPYLLWTPWLYAYLAPFVLFHRFVVVVGAVCMFALLGSRYARVIAWTSLILLLIQMVFLPITRYGYPVVALWLLLIPVAASELWKRFKGVRE